MKVGILGLVGFLLVACEPTLTLKKEPPRITASRGECYEEIILLKHAAGTDTMSYLHIPVMDSVGGEVVLRLHKDCNMGVGAHLDRWTANDWIAWQVVYTGQDPGKVWKKNVRQAFDGSDKWFGNVNGYGNGSNSGGHVGFLRIRGRLELDDFGRDTFALQLIRDMVLESAGKAFEDPETFIFQEIFSTRSESTVYTTRIEEQ